MESDDPRAVLAGLVERHGHDYAGLSRLLGRNSAYIQQYIKRGTPRQLAEEDRRTLAIFYGVDEALLGAPPRPPEGTAMRTLPALDVGASAGHGGLAGGLAGDSAAPRRFAFDPAWLRSIASDTGALSLIRVQGDSMEPALRNGDDIMVERLPPDRPVREGIHVIRMDGTLMVKRLALAPGGRISVMSDNDAYPSFRDQPRASIEVIGRVRWVGRSL